MGVWWSRPKARVPALGGWKGSQRPGVQGEVGQGLPAGFRGAIERLVPTPPERAVNASEQSDASAATARIQWPGRMSPPRAKAAKGPPGGEATQADVGGPVTGAVDAPRADTPGMSGGVARVVRHPDWWDFRLPRAVD